MLILCLIDAALTNDRDWQLFVDDAITGRGVELDYAALSTGDAKAELSLRVFVKRLTK
jgi:hypothetical protein